MKLKKFLCIPLCSLPFLSLISLSTQQTNHSKVISNQIQANSESKNTSMWEQSFKESASNNNPKLILSRDASLAYQQVILLSEYLLLQNENGKSKADVLLFYYWLYYENNVNNPQSSDYWSVKQFEDKWDSISQGKDWTFKLVNNSSKLNSSTDYNYFNFPDEDFMNVILSYYSDPSIQFDVWILDYSLADIWQQDNTYDLLKRTNKFYVLTDGNYQTSTFVNNALKRYQEPDYKQLSQQEIESKFASYKKDTNDSLKSDFQSYSLYDFINDEKMFTFFHTKEYTNSSYYLDKLDNSNIELYKTYDINYNYYDLAYSLFDEEEISKTFMDDYEKFFNIYNVSNLENFIFRNFESYDPNKKNIIWLGDSLVLNQSNIYPEREKEVRNTFQSWLKLFPYDEYNWFVKHHTRYTEDQSIWLTDWIIDSDDDSNIIYFKKVPWEIFISWDYKNKKVNSSYNSFFSNISEQNNNYPRFIGYQYTTTVIQSTAFFLEDSYGYTNEIINDCFNPFYWPIPEYFDVVSRQNQPIEYPDVQVEINKNKIAEIYDPYVDNGAYPSYKNEQVTSSKFIQEVYNPNYENNLVMPLAMSVVVGISIGLILIPLIIFIG
ncbi:MAG: hypothetical protein K2O21_01385, partial [Malacoplasma sp.]|nr:hypothetical protein [Malacoplasma sp.]